MRDHDKLSPSCASSLFVADLFRKAGYDVKAPYDLYQVSSPFDFIAEKDSDIYAVKVRTTKLPCGKTGKSKQNTAQINRALRFNLPVPTIRMLWHHSLQYQEHTTYAYKPWGFIKMDNPLVHMLPPPLPRKRLGRPPDWTKIQQLPDSQ